MCQISFFIQYHSFIKGYNTFLPYFCIYYSIVLQELWNNGPLHNKLGKMLKTKQCDYKRLYEKYVGQMYSYGKALGVDDDVLYDLIHDVFLHFFEHQNEIVDNDNVKYYLFRCLKNRMISEKRKEVTMEDIDESDDYLFSITVSGLDYIEEEEERKEIAEQIENMLCSLTGRQREAIYLRYMQELEYDEIAVLLNLTTKGTRKLIYRAIERMREQYGPVLFYFFLSDHFFSF